jgi:YegS/Rv2252/BmrU family lipid kinase
MRTPTVASQRRVHAPAKLDVFVVFNPVAARAESSDARRVLEEALTSRGLRHQIEETGKGEDGRQSTEQSIQQALASGCRRVIAVGGDGTISLAAAPLIGSKRRGLEPTLGIVPTGTANVLARELGIPMAIGDAVTLALDGDRTIELDAIEAPDRIVLTQVGVGLDALMIRDTSRKQQIQKGRLAYATAFLQRALALRSNNYRLEVDGVASDFRAYQIVVANVGALGAPPFTWGPGIDPSDGTLDVCVFRTRSIRHHLQLIGRLLTGQHRTSAGAHYILAEERITITSRRPVLVQGDGELLGTTPITLGVLRGALRVCVPRPIEDLEATPGAPADGVSVDPRAPDDVRATIAANEAARADPKTLVVAEPAEKISEDVEAMVAEHSRTWVLQGWLKHPLSYLAALDAAIYLRINAVQLGSVADRALILVSRVMHYGEGWAIVFVFMLLTDFRVGLRAGAEALPVLWATMLTVNFPLKNLFRRPRPFVSFVQARVRGLRPLDSSFPSGHTAAAFAGALLFSAHLPWWSPAFYALAAVVGFSRVYLGAHYLSDVVVGGVVGSLLAGVYLALLRMALGTG